ncbi:diguanylate cyclase (GGDEF)-like protein [Paenibacillus castaneae]|uniref:histidine kinase N-terminal 7TM domain-containing diguanylate cyclase n=1 Tax=Paenibacillus castaneae TaxID=474957 RepID=UPI000C99A432|nr:histidine kinase N-terminal 7TM domain-containing protein [Paenibacillus castaneae]NIK79107.1 diguanylate cyclase (GGDEF)-like protein [Paenibacillus castaneae]
MIMNSPISHYIIIVIIAGVLSVLLAIYAYFKKTNFSGMNMFVWTSSLTALYTFAFAFELASDSLREIRFWVNIEYMGMPFIAPCSLLLVMHYVGLEQFTQRKIRWLLFVIPAITLLMVLTNEYHHLFYRSFYLRPNVSSPLADVVPDIWYYVHGGYTFGTMFASLFLLFSYWKKTKTIYRRQIAMMALGISLPMTGALLYVLGMVPLGMDPVPILLCITSLLYVLSIFSTGMLTVAPIAREHIFESMRDGVLVLNLSNQIMDFNSAAAQIIPALTSSTIGKKLEHIWRRGAESGAFSFGLDPSGEHEQELKWIRGKETFYYRVRASDLLSPNGQIAGRIIVMIDVTEHTLLQNKLRHLAEIDGLTSIYNRNYFMEKSRELLEDARSKHQPISFILFDIDYFKQINDRYGHSLGDFALQHTVNICQQTLDASAVFARYGGEEFAICLPKTTIAEAGHIAEQIRKQIAENPLYSAAKAISITASFGVTEAVDEAHVPLEALLRDADDALYRSKHKGRNSVHLSNGEYLHANE